MEIWLFDFYISLIKIFKFVSYNFEVVKGIFFFLRIILLEILLNFYDFLL